MQHCRKFLKIPWLVTAFTPLISTNSSSHEVQCQAYVLDIINASFNHDWWNSLFLGALQLEASFPFWK